MKKIILIAAIALSAVCCNKQEGGSQESEFDPTTLPSKVLEIGDYSSIDCGSGVEVRYMASCSTPTLYACDYNQKIFYANVEKGTLLLYHYQEGGYIINQSSYVYLPINSKLGKMHAKGTIRFNDKFTAKKLTVSTEVGGVVRGEFSCSDSLKVDIDFGDLYIKGNASTLKLSCYMGNFCPEVKENPYGRCSFTADVADIYCKSYASFVCNKKIKGEVNFGGLVEYKGNADVSECTVASGAELKKID